MDATHGGLGGTYGGNPIACAALAVFETIQADARGGGLRSWVARWVNSRR